MRTCFFICCAALVLIITGRVAAQPDTDSIKDSARVDLPRLFIDCDSCDQDYFRTEIGFVNFVRDRKQADIYVLITDQTTAAGGKEFTLELIGYGTFAGAVDTLRYVSEQSATEDNIRKGLTQTIKLGLMRYVARMPVGKDIRIAYRSPAAESKVKDKWNYWVFSVEAMAYLNGQKSFSSTSLYGELLAQRTTEQSKTSLSLWSNYEESRFDLGDDIEVVGISRTHGLQGMQVWSLTDHWSAGASATLYSSTYSNISWYLWEAGVIEYDVFPYSESTRRLFTILYRIGTNYLDYEEETIYGKKSEWVVNERLAAQLALIQPWGSVSTTLEGSNYMHDFDRYRLQVSSKISLKLFEGFSLDIEGAASRVHDQLSLPRGGASDEEVLLRQRELATSYQYWTNIGLRYSFGSIYNNIVNPRITGH